MEWEREKSNKEWESIYGKGGSTEREGKGSGMEMRLKGRRKGGGTTYDFTPTKALPNVHEQRSTLSLKPASPPLW